MEHGPLALSLLLLTTLIVSPFLFLDCLGWMLMTEILLGHTLSYFIPIQLHVPYPP